MKLEYVINNLQVDNYVRDYLSWIKKYNLRIPNKLNLIKHDLYHVTTKFGVTLKEETALRLIELKLEHGHEKVTSVGMVDDVHEEIANYLQLEYIEFDYKDYMEVIFKFDYGLPIVKLYLDNLPVLFWDQVNSRLNNI